MSEALTVRGRIVGNDVTVVWEDGVLSGDERAVRVVKAIAEMGGTIETPGGLPTADAGLGDRYSAAHTIFAALDVVDSVEGGPELPEPEPGSVAGSAR